MAPSVSHAAGSGLHRARAKALQQLSTDKLSSPFAKSATGRHSEFGGKNFRYIVLLLLVAFFLYISFASSHAKVKQKLVENPAQILPGNLSLPLYENRTDLFASANGTSIVSALPDLIALTNLDDTEEDEALVNDAVNKCAVKPPHWTSPPERTNGYLLVRSNGGLNQMRAAICDMVAVTRLINATMVIPELDKSSFWADKSEFGDVFDLPHFLESLKDEIPVVEHLPPEYSHLTVHNVYTMDPVSWSGVGYYTKVLLPLLKKHEVIRLYQTDSRLANNPPDVPKSIQRLRCRVQYHALQFTKPLRKLGDRIIRRLHKQGPFIALHLRYEMDMLAFTGCSHGCTEVEELKLTRLRYRTARWREKNIDGVQRRRAGDCPLTPEEVGLMLRALGYNKTTQLYIASGKIYGGKRRLARLLSVFPNTLRKEMLVTPEELAPFRNHSSQLAALDYMVSVAADVFLSTFHGNMARLVEGHRRYLGYRKTIIPNRKRLVEVFDAYENGTKTWKKLCSQVVKAHKNRLGGPQLRSLVPGRPKEEDNFFQNPQECICSDNDAVLENGGKGDEEPTPLLGSRLTVKPSNVFNEVESHQGARQAEKSSIELRTSVQLENESESFGTAEGVRRTINIR